MIQPLTTERINKVDIVCMKKGNRNKGYEEKRKWGKLAGEQNKKRKMSAPGRRIDQKNPSALSTELEQIKNTSIKWESSKFLIASTLETVHPQNLRFQNVRFQNVRFQNVRFQNVRFTKRQVYRTSGFKTSGFKTSIEIKASKRQLFKFDILIKQKI